MEFPRATGILLHPTSLPSRGGIGDFGPAAYQFADFLAAARQAVWQVLPLGPLGYGNSPYSSVSAFAGNPLLISLERLAERGWIDPKKLTDLLPNQGAVDYDRVFAQKMPLLFEAGRQFLASAPDVAREIFRQFRQENAWWLDDFALFDALRAQRKLQSWNEWPRELARRDSPALQKARLDLADSIEIRCAIQFAFFEQWQALRVYCAERAIRFVGDVAIFVNYDSADVWTHPELFQLNAELAPEVIAGVPPDYFSKTGQRWGNPLYRWDVMKADGYQWWIQRLRWASSQFDWVRLDHFRGFEQYWEIPAGDPDATRGRWMDGPKDDLFVAIRSALGGLPFFAEDLGMITPEVLALRERFALSGMSVLQFAFGDVGSHIYLPHRAAGKVIYTGTHDNDTCAGWWNSGASEQERLNAEAYLGPLNPDGIHWASIRAVQSSPATLSVVPFQDVLGLGSDSRMNVPSVPGGNWKWRIEKGALKPEIAEKLARLAFVTDRMPQAFKLELRRDFFA
jgi:4-alpha-glucanotransferase